MFTVNLEKAKARSNVPFYLHLFIPSAFPFVHFRLIPVVPPWFSLLLPRSSSFPGRTPRITSSVYAGPGPISVEIQGERSRIGFGGLGNCSGVISLAPPLSTCGRGYLCPSTDFLSPSFPLLRLLPARPKRSKSVNGRAGAVLGSLGRDANAEYILTGGWLEAVR